MQKSLSNPLPAIAEQIGRAVESVRMQVYEEPMLINASMALVIMIALLLPAATTSVGSSQLHGAAAAIGNGISLSGGFICASILILTPLVNLVAALRQAWLAISRDSTEISVLLYIALAANIGHLLIVGNALKTGWAIGPVAFTGMAIPITILAIVTGVIFSIIRR